jgi:hypothetical protein
MRDGLDPRKTYTKKEITTLCKEHGIALGHLCGICVGSQKYGQILHRQSTQNIHLHPSLATAFEVYF